MLSTAEYHISKGEYERGLELLCGVEAKTDKIKASVAFISAEAHIGIGDVEQAKKEFIEKVKRKKYKNVLFLTTSLTNKSNYFQNECEKYQIKYKIKSCPELVEMVENNLINKDKIKDILKEEFNGNYDAIVLGCTHFYYLEKDITKLFPNAKIITGFDVLLSKIKKELKLLKLKNSRVNKSKISVYKT